MLTCGSLNFSQKLLLKFKWRNRKNLVRSLSLSGWMWSQWPTFDACGLDGGCFSVRLVKNGTSNAGSDGQIHDSLSLEETFSAHLWLFKLFSEASAKIQMEK